MKKRILSILLTAAMISMMFTLPLDKVYAANPDAYVYVGTYEEFMAALADPVVNIINVTNDFSLDADVIIDRYMSITSNTANTVNTGSHSLIVGGGGDVRLYGNLSMTGSSTTVEVVSGGAISLTASYTGTISTTGSGGKALYAVGGATAVNMAGGSILAGPDANSALCVGDTHSVYLSGGTISGSGSAYDIYMEQGYGTIGINISESGPNIGNVYYYWSPSDAPELTGDYPLLTGLPAPISMCIGEELTVDTGSFTGDEVYLSFIAGDYPAELNVSSSVDKTMTLSPDTTGIFNLTLRLRGVVLTLPVTVTTGFAGGDGTEYDPYQIETAEQLNRVRNFLGPECKDTYFQLTAPIDLSSYSNWVPIGDDANPFCGHFYGCIYDNIAETNVFYPITNLNINRPDEQYVGLFGYCASAEIGGVAIRNANVSGGSNTGVLVGQTIGYIASTYKDTQIFYCSSSGSVTSTNGWTGGLVGIASQTQILESYSTASVIGTNSNAGGLVGGLYSASIIDCYATGQVTSTGENNYAGGLVGVIMNSNGHIYTSYAAGHVTGEDETGGLIGNMNSGNVSQSYFNIANASSSDDESYYSKGIGLKTIYMMYESSYFDSWDFPNSYSSSYTWMIGPDMSYPYLRNNEQTPHPEPPSATSAEIALIPGPYMYDTSTKTLTVNYNDYIEAFSVENIIPADGFTILSSSDPNVVDVYWSANGDIAIYAISVGTATISLKSSDDITIDTITVIVEPITLTVTGDFEVENKEYDGSTNAVITSTSTLELDTSGCVWDDIANLAIDFVATFSDPDVGQNKAVSLSNSTLTGTAAGNYVLDFSSMPEATGTITPKELTIGGSFTAQDKAYDQTTDAAFASDNLTLIGRVGSDDVTLLPVLTFDTPDIGTGKTVYIAAGSSLTGAKAGNYTLSIIGAPTYTSGVITDKQVTLDGSFIANNKEYSGDKAATIATSNLTLVGVSSGDDVSIASVTAEFASPNVGSGKTVRIVGVSLAGANAANYAVSLTGAPTAVANITAKPLTITGSFTVNDRQYNGMTNAEIDTNNLVLSGIIGSDTVSLNASAAFSDVNVGTGKTITLIGSSLTGVDAANYILDLTGAPTATANITKATGLQAPAAPTLQSKTSTSVTLTPNADQEFSMDNGTTWQTSNIFTGLTPSTDYSFITRIKDDANHEASPVSPVLTVKTDPSSSGGGGGGGGSTPALPTPTQKTHQISISLDPSKVDKEIQKVLEQGENIVRIIVDESDDDNADEIDISIDKDAVRMLSDNEVALEIKTEGVSIQMPKETLQAISEDGEDIFFRVTPIDGENEKTAAIENAITAKVVQTATGGGEAVTLGTPMMIETNYQGYSTKLVFSLKDIKLPEDEEERALFLSGLGVHINHSDGEQEFNRGRIIYDADGNPVGLEIEISKFSTFTMISIINEAPYATDPSITGKAEYGKKVTASYTYNDKEQDKEGKSLICWYRADSKKGKNKKLVAEGTLKYKIVKADQGKYLILEITPIAKTGELTGSTVLASVKVAANKAPKAAGAKISGKTAVGSKLTLKYTYQDAESDKEGKTTIQWYRANSADGAGKQKIKNANKSTYTLTKADLGKYIIAEIKPVAKTGNKTGSKTTVASKTAVKVK